jgi:RNA polymerase sigma-70 factor, ECF subfamily
MSFDDHSTCSLLRLAAADEPDAWTRMVALYSPLVRFWCRRASVPDHETQDVLQEVFVAVYSNLKKFQVDPRGTTLRAWMRGITRHKIQHYFQDRGEAATGGTQAHVRLLQVPGPADEFESGEEPTGTAAVCRRALSRVRDQFEERTWTAFWWVAVEDRSPAEVAAEMGLTPCAVRKAKSRVIRRLKEEMGELIV